MKRLVLVVALLALGGCADPPDSTYLPALRQDSMATWGPAGAATPVRSFATGYRAGGTAAGKRRQAQILKVFQLADDAAAAAAVTAGWTAAQAAGWTPGAVRGLFIKAIAGGQGQLTVLRGDPDRRQVVLSLTVTP
ncbi:hypothetical protein [Actinoplanes sp. N902-109]|uniref:hypothetical protein n=1 Tax=Actinoplanes sp. (strain N902-109) TaxID=649831 RepID=UPI0003295E2E|nr:hypothetical protein [Actinoplanes sp. N902-109]AGL17445.1 hypothetical protein L083_3935 [Actinoplanes sp. N902-109]